MRMKPKSTVHNPRALLYKRFTDLETSLKRNPETLYKTVDNKLWQFSAEMVKFIEWTGDTTGKTPIEVGSDTSQTYLRFADTYFAYIIVDGVGKWIITRTAGDGEESISLTYENLTAHFFNRVEQLDGINMQTNPYPANISFTTDTGVEFVRVVLVTNTKQILVYQRIFSEYEAGTFEIPLLQGTDASDIPERTQNANEIYISVTVDEESVQGTYNISFSIPTIPIETLGTRFSDIGRYQTNKYYLAGSFDYMIRGSINSEDSQPIKGNILHLRSFEIKYFDDRINIDHDDLVVIDGRLYGVESLAYDIKRSPKPYTVYFATLNNIK